MNEIWLEYKYYFLTGMWLVYKFHKYLWTDKVDKGEVIAKGKSIEEVEYKTKKYITSNYEEGYSIEKYEEFNRSTNSYRYTDFVIKVMHTICIVIFVPVRVEKDEYDKH